MRLEERALSGDYFVSCELCPDAAFRTGLAYRATGSPAKLVTVTPLHNKTA